MEASLLACNEALIFSGRRAQRTKDQAQDFRSEWLNQLGRVGLLTQSHGPGWESWDLDTWNKDVWMDMFKEFMANPSGRTTVKLPGVLEQSHVICSGELNSF